MGAAVVVQVLVGFRNDCAAHLIGGAALFLGVGLAVPAPLARRVGDRSYPWLVLVIPSVAVLVLEVLLLGPFDPLDVSLSVLGGLLVAPTAVRAVRADRSTRRSWAFAVGVLALSAAVVRYGHSLFGLDVGIWSNSR